LAQASLNKACKRNKHIPLPIKKLAVKTVINLLRGVINLGKAFRFIFVSGIIKPLGVIFHSIFIKGLFFQLYKAYRQVKIYLKKIFSVIKLRLLHPFASSRIGYLVIIFLVAFVTFSNFYTKETVAASVGGQESLLYTLFVGEEEEIIEYVDEQTNEAVLPTSYLQEEPALEKITQIGEPIEEEESGTLLVEGGSALTKPTIITEDPETAVRDEVIFYTVEGGDSISTIARKFGITTNSILWLNGLSYYDYIKPNQKLSIPPTSGVVHKVAKGETLGAIVKKYNGDLDKTVEFNKLGSAHNIKEGDKIMVPDGQPPRQVSSRRSQAAAYVSNIIPPPSASVPAGSKMLWPTTSHTINQYYSWRHHGLDIDGTLSSPIYAAEGGTITRVGWGRGYGNVIDIDHGNGKVTRYAHLSKFFVKKGQQVAKGETIGMIGSTGWSTGPHLHFEVIIYGSKKNPLGYIK